jgi:anti-sigma factor RsiW
MKQCWPEGTLRAYLDGELPPQEMRSVAAHLEECADCTRVHSELSVRASYVGGLLDTLAVPAPKAVPRAVPAKKSGSWAWTGAAVALAAGLAIAAMLIPKQEPQKIVQAPPAQQPQPVRSVQQEPAPAAIPVAVAPSRRVVAQRTPRAKLADAFIALDNEPIESGIVMRVELPGSTPADIVFSPDGRARAVRLVSGTQRN